MGLGLRDKDKRPSWGLDAFAGLALDDKVVPCSLEQGSFGKAFEVALAAAAAVAGFGSSGLG